MCGLAGMIDPRLSRDEGDGLLDRMLTSIRHRGPDNSARWLDGPVYLGHNRLSIIALTSDANQPMLAGDLVLVYNGEVYNYLELRAELELKGHRFRTASDTEVVLEAYREWGPSCVQRFMGMWAFAIWDRAKRELFCSRDRFGIKPFYYIHAGDRFYFGSEYKPLRLSPLFSGRLNRQQVSRGLTLQLVSYRDESYFEGITVLPERSNLLFKDGRVSVTRYWELDPGRRFHGSQQDKEARFLDLFRDSVKLHLRSDVPLGGCLSGGLDSSAIASVIGRDHADVPLTAFTIHYTGPGMMDEREWVAEVLKAYPDIRPVSCAPSDAQVAAVFDEVLGAHDVPFPHSMSLSYHFLIEAAVRHGMKVMIDGQGADEYLAGYQEGYNRLIAGYLRRLRLPSAWRALHWPAARQRSGRRRLLRRSWRVATRGEQGIYDGFRRSGSSTLGIDPEPECVLDRVVGTPLKQYFYHQIFTRILPSMLHYQDRIAMSWSIENRVPFLDHRLVEFVYSLDDDDLIRMGQRKYIMRATLRSYLPPPIANRTSKQPFAGVNTSAWLRGPLGFLFDRPIDFDRLDMLDPSKTGALLEAFRRGDDAHAQLVWRLAVLKRWLEIQ